MNVKVCLLQIFNYLSEVKKSVTNIELNCQIIHCKNRLDIFSQFYDYLGFTHNYN